MAIDEKLTNRYRVSVQLENRTGWLAIGSTETYAESRYFINGREAEELYPDAKAFRITDTEKVND